MAIQTVLGSIDKKMLGFCHSHEHLFVANGKPAQINAALRIDDLDKTMEELLLFRQIGGNSIVDAQPLGCGRMEMNLIEASLRCHIHIIAATGFHKLAFYAEDHWIYRYDEAALADVFIHELTHGMFVHSDRQDPRDSVRSKAGIIKTAIDEERMADPEKKWFRATARAALETGTPLLCHTESGEQAVALVDFYREQGIPARQIIICHLDRTLDQMETHKQLAKQGVYLEYDTIGRYKYHSDEQEAELIKDMVDSGFEDLLLLGLDTTRARLKSYGGDIGLDHISRRFLPLLKQYGVAESAVAKMMINNPAVAFENKLSK
ncbi:phosphotriesterase family protein [Paenibacillus radicis (ex Xue et al. 2023)]|uniref:Phosphotriesterase-related protein n=1 Tax=Paenibacillus radicis (ex Xue et al. 2023) TaxID=2972489 RepID=A0ABT1YJZ9_9BACL|nr:hypothetical protein [Paenibacillus radicis (ex Xue et al. 2023)]MCR8633050.1 hypothetical protein [Paenibacillus radicis (ex Xue et al. 2023)]